jgi:hypothetical protein
VTGRGVDVAENACWCGAEDRDGDCEREYGEWMPQIQSNPIRIPVDFHDAIRREPGKGRDASSVRFRFRIPGLEAWPD